MKMPPVKYILLLLTMGLNSAVLARSLYGDASVFLHKHGVEVDQVNVFKDDRYIVEVYFKPNQWWNEPIAHIQIVQYIHSVSATITVDLDRQSDELYTVKGIVPFNKLCAGGNVRSLNAISKSVIGHIIVLTNLKLQSKEKKNVPLENIYQITMTSFYKVSSPGVQVLIFPNP